MTEGFCTQPMSSPVVAHVGKAHDRRDHVRRAELIRRVHAEFVEMPCLRLTAGQAERLFGLRPDVCHRVLTALSAERVIWQASDGRYSALDS